MNLYSTKPEIIIPSFLTEDNEPRVVGKLWWYWCRVRFWRYRINPYTGILTQINSYSRFWDIYLQQFRGK